MLIKAYSTSGRERGGTLSRQHHIIHTFHRTTSTDYAWSYEETSTGSDATLLKNCTLNVNYRRIFLDDKSILAVGDEDCE